MIGRSGKISILALPCLLGSLAASGADGPVVTATIHRLPFSWTAADFRVADERSKQLFTRGLVDGFLSAKLFFGSDRRLDALHDCLSAMTLPQVTSVLDKYLQAHTDRWQWVIQALAYDAFTDACPEFNKD